MAILLSEVRCLQRRSGGKGIYSETPDFTELLRKHSPQPKIPVHMNPFHATFGSTSRDAAIYGLKDRIGTIPTSFCHLLSFFNRLLSGFVKIEIEWSNKKGLIGGRNGFSLNWHDD